MIRGGNLCLLSKSNYYTNSKTLTMLTLTLRAFINKFFSTYRSRKTSKPANTLCTEMVLGQNGSGQNGTDKMVWTKWYTDKMVLDKMVWTKWYGQNGTILYF